MNRPVTKTHYKYEIAIFLPVVLHENLAQLFNEFVRKDKSSNSLQGMQKLMEPSTIVKLVIQSTAGCVAKGFISTLLVWDI